MKNLSKNLLSLLLSDAVRRSLGFLSVAYLARVVGVSAFGAVSLSLTILSYLIMVSSGGLHVFGTREVARSDSAALVNEIIGTRLANAVASYVLLVGLCFLFVRDGILLTLFLVTGLSVFFQSLSLEWYFQGKEQMQVFSRARAVSSFVYLLVLILFVRSPATIILAGAAAVAGDCSAAVVMWRSYSKSSNSLSPSFSYSRWKSLMGEALPMGVGTVLAHLSVNIPPLAIGILMTTQDVGVYSAASKLTVFLLVIDRMLATLLLPASARLHSISPESLSTILSSALKWITLIGIPACLGGIVLSAQILTLVYGPVYEAAIPVFRVMIWFFFLTMLHTVYTAGMLAAGQEKIFGRVMAVSAVLYFISSLVLIHFYGPVGGALAVVLSEGATVLIMQRRLKQFVKVESPGSVGRIIAASLVMSAVLLLIPPVRLPVAVLLGIGMYGFLVLVSRAVTIDELSSLTERFV